MSTKTNPCYLFTSVKRPATLPIASCSAVHLKGFLHDLAIIAHSVSYRYNPAFPKEILLCRSVRMLPSVYR